MRHLAIILIPALIACSGSSGGPEEPPPNGGGLDPPPVIVTDQLPDSVATRPFVAQVAATTDYPPLRWTLEGAPAWMRIDPASGRVWGEAPLPGTTPITIRATDAENQATDKTLDVVARSPLPSLQPIALLPSPDALDGAFRTARKCADCHSNSVLSVAMRDQALQPVAPFDLWQASAMAVAFRDPWYRAVVAVERTVHPDLGDALETVCLRCHAPMAQEASDATLVMADALSDSARGSAARDGVSCTLCHQISDDDLGEPDSFSGNFRIADGKPAIGPHDQLFAMPMTGSSGYVPQRADYSTGSELCATCHTLFTQTHDLDGNPLPQYFPEQTPYLEWTNSDYGRDPGKRTCGDCHFPETGTDGLPIETTIARRPDGSDFPPIVPRSDYGRHEGMGGNALLAEMMAARSAELAPHVQEAQFLELAHKTRSFLRKETATLEVRDAVRTPDGLAFDVRIRILTGHKFPTSYPSRRAWLHVVVKDGAGVTRFESGRFDARGRIVDAGGVPLPFEAEGGPIEPHRAGIESADQVAIYEPVLADVTGNPSYLLLHAAHYYKDNRLLPQGWSFAHPEIDAMAPVGTGQDPDFGAGGDDVRYTVGLPAGVPGPLTVEAQLVYQPISARFVHEILAWEALEAVRDFRDIYNSVSRAPDEVATDTATVP